jgi:hypothetical protein
VFVFSDFSIIYYIFYKFQNFESRLSNSFTDQSLETCTQALAKNAMSAM